MTKDGKAKTQNMTKYQLDKLYNSQDTKEDSLPVTYEGSVWATTRPDDTDSIEGDPGRKKKTKLVQPNRDA